MRRRGLRLRVVVVLQRRVHRRRARRRARRRLRASMRAVSGEAVRQWRRLRWRRDVAVVRCLIRVDVALVRRRLRVVLRVMTRWRRTIRIPRRQRSAVARRRRAVGTRTRRARIGSQRRTSGRTWKTAQVRGVLRVVGGVETNRHVPVLLWRRRIAVLVVPRRVRIDVRSHFSYFFPLHSLNLKPSVKLFLHYHFFYSDLQLH